MALIDDLAEALADDTLLAMDNLSNDRLYLEVAKAIGALSPSLQEAFLTACRLRLAEQRGRRFLEATLRAAETGTAAPVAPPEPESGL
ncbi:hypothetical protein CCR83_07475 [Rhodobacter veldkampii DSM 11550]|uniref:Uncharacterized protein n=1 Tax=Phaeovulum veldkampii DSM 11550 TaxID=1185920 RepID=A0A2T4JG90_9RHOB|nr:hypothetical protein [Phaeovulum veldkampii]MBK5946279.1 hypothetical protein [Phaeovulum veldkampii DSM 11550]PTE16932.1 hypothetical protein C5F46_11750 [Phaeovulum veldkampii DSM 11550]TDQ56462.1 hypothetical protein EV658_11848 [Phaeovulum veldkampii DSM 11550]